MLGTLHTTSAAKAVDRIIDVFPGDEKTMVRSMLSNRSAVVSQTLLKRQGGGRVAAHEVLVATSAVRNLIREDKTAQIYSAIQTGGKSGYANARLCARSASKKRLSERRRGAIAGQRSARSAGVIAQQCAHFRHGVYVWRESACVNAAEYPWACCTGDRW